MEFGNHFEKNENNIIKNHHVKSRSLLQLKTKLSSNFPSAQRKNYTDELILTKRKTHTQKHLNTLVLFVKSL